jgi:repressor LexA
MPALSSNAIVKKPIKDLNAVEVRVLDYLARTLRPGFCPSREELSQAAGLGNRGSSITSTLQRLEAKGYLELGRGRSRSITLHRTADGQRFSGETVWVPVAEPVAVEPPRRAEPISSSAVGEAIELARSMLDGREDVYAIRVHDQSLHDALVNPGDVVILARSSEVANGQLAAVRVTGRDGRKTSTLKHYYRENGHVRLQPAHPDMPPLFYRPDQVTIQGRVMLIIRQFPEN